MSKTIEIKLSTDDIEGTEATVSQWLKNIGDDIEVGEPIVELETDKVSMEICAPESGILTSINIEPGSKIESDLVLGLISDSIDIKSTSMESENLEPEELEPEEKASNNEETLKDISNNESLANNTSTTDSKSQLSPAVKRLVKENNLDISQISGSGKNGRVNRFDVMSYLEKTQLNKSQATAISDAHQSKMIPHTNMRKSIAKHMCESLLEISPHVTSVFDMNMSNIIEHRKWHKKEFLEQGVNLTFTAYFISAITKAIQATPEVNARYHQDALEIFNHINIGVGTALADKGLIVPVIKNIQTMNLYQIAEALTQQTEKARSGKLSPSEMKGGTFTLSNHGVSGSLFAAPIIINQPEVAILGIGKLEKRVVVEEINGQDTIQIKPMCYVSLSIDHRALDAYHTNQFLTVFVDAIENWGQ